MDNYKFLEDSPWFIFMNHGYSPASKLLDENNIFINSASLYLKLLDDIDTKGKTILDVGCGRGGGVKTYSEVLEFNKIHACDYNEKFIDFCKHTHTGIEFDVCSATSLSEKYKEKSFDIITNVESSHCYYDGYADPISKIGGGNAIREKHILGLNMFFDGVKSILKPNGVFCYTDSFSTLQLDELKLSTFEDGFKNIISTDITNNVILACEEMLEKNIPKMPNGIVKKFIENTTSGMYFNYTKNGMKYLTFVCYT